MARVFNGSSQYLSASSTLLTNEPIDIITYTNVDAITTAYCLASLGNSGAASGYFALYFRGDVASDPVEANKQADGGGSGGQARTSASSAAGTWFVSASSFVSNTSRNAFYNGGSKGTNTTNVADPTPDYVTLGVYRTNTLANYLDGNLAEAYILDVNMTDAQHALAGKGISPFWLIPGKNVRAWYPLQGHNNNRVRNGYPDLTATGSPTNGTHPARVMRPRLNGVMAV